MKVLGVIFLIGFILFILFGKVEMRNVERTGLRYKIFGGIIWALVLDLVIGLPILGIISLLGF